MFCFKVLQLILGFYSPSLNNALVVVKFKTLLYNNPWTEDGLEKKYFFFPNHLQSKDYYYTL